MKYDSAQMEEQAVLATAARMSAAARTAPKGVGKDSLVTMVLTGDDKDKLADKMVEVGDRELKAPDSFFHRDAANLKAAQAVLLIGLKNEYLGLPFCSHCGFANCAQCREAGGRCAIKLMDLGIALGSAAAIAADDFVDTRIMFSVGKAASEMDYSQEPNLIWMALPLSVSSKSIFFDRAIKSIAPKS